MKPRLSVVLATRNRRALLESTLEALLAQEWPASDYEIVVADNGSTDGTADGVRHIAARPGVCAVRYLFVGEPGKSRALNAALPHVRGDLLALTDDDVRPDPRWLAAIAAAFDGGVQFVVGRVLPDWEAPPPGWMSPALYGVLAVPDGGTTDLPIARGLNEHIMAIGANMAVRADVVRRIGGFRTDLGKLEGTLRTGEDHEFFLRLLHTGCRGVYEPRALVRHRVGAERLVPSYFRRWFHQNGRDVATLERAYPPTVAHLLGVPRYLWREAASKTLALARPSATRADRFAASVGLLWFAGYVRQAWRGTEPEAWRA